MNVFISMPMHGCNKESRFIVRESAKSRIYGYVRSLPDNWPKKPANDMQVHFLHNEWEETYPHRLQYLGRSISLMSAADLVVFADSWMSAGGCLVEQLTAKLYKIPYIAEYPEYVLLWEPSMGDRTIKIKKEAPNTDEHTKPTEAV